MKPCRNYKWSAKTRVPGGKKLFDLGNLEERALGRSVQTCVSSFILSCLCFLFLLFIWRSRYWATSVAACLITLLSFFLSHYCHPFSSSLHLSILPSLSCTLPQTCTHAHTQTHTHLCFSWHFFSVISSNTTLSSCLITKQGHYICLHELPSLCGCGCVCVGVCEAYGHSLSHTQTLIHAPWTLCSTISLLNSLPPHLYSSPPPPHLVLRLSLLHLTHF